VSEIISLNKKTIFIPLKNAQFNEQYHNAMEANQKIGSVVLKEDDIGLFLNSMRELIESSESVFAEAQKNSAQSIILKQVQF
jgi:UDP-N-acetylglucosamine--N-acetylmuramyl-(pentapeptide) pyrophosphoryl-undecaprenol N-acetylglucosamine transferase